MKKKVEYTDAPKDVEDALLNATEIEDFLPPPEQLIEKITDNNLHPEVDMGKAEGSETW